MVHLHPTWLLPIDIETFRLNGSKWIQTQRSMKEAFALPDLSPKSFLHYANQMISEKGEITSFEDKLQQYCVIVAGDRDEY